MGWLPADEGILEKTRGIFRQQVDDGGMTINNKIRAYGVEYGKETQYRFVRV